MAEVTVEYPCPDCRRQHHIVCDVNPSEVEWSDEAFGEIAKFSGTVVRCLDGCPALVSKLMLGSFGEPGTLLSKGAQ